MVGKRIYHEDDFCKAKKIGLAEKPCFAYPTRKRLCDKHYRTMRKRAIQATGRSTMQLKSTVCKVYQCERFVTCKELCNAHYTQSRRHPEKFALNKLKQ